MYSIQPPASGGAGDSHLKKTGAQRTFQGFKKQI